MADPITRARQAFDQGQADEAERILEASLEDSPKADRARRLLALSQLCAAQYKLLRVEALAPELLDNGEFHNSATVMLMENAARLGNRALLASRCKAMYASRKTLSPPEFSTWVDYLLRSGCLAECRDLAADLETVTGRKQRAIRSAIAVEEGDYGGVDELLTNGFLAAKPLLNYRKGLALDRLGRFDEAFEYFGRGAAFRKSRLPELGPDPVPVFEALLDNEAFTRRSRHPEPGGETPGLAFLFGFPRSGTTLLENVLDTQDRISVMPERPALFFVKQAMTGEMGKRYPADLLSLEESELNRLRGVYLGKAADMGFEAGRGTLLVDKGPHHTIDLPLIRLLFPQARLVLSLRHPLDVCLSCYQQDFELNANTRDLIAIEDIVARYRRVFALYGRYEETLELEVTRVKYEDLVRDFEGQVEGVFAALGHVPDTDYHDFPGQVAGKFIQSSSRGQAEQPLYDSSIDRWKNYQEHLAPHALQLKNPL